MLRETGGTIRRPPTGECDCGILEDVVVGLNGVIGEDTDAEVIEEGKRAPNCSNVIHCVSDYYAHLLFCCKPG